MAPPATRAAVSDDVTLLCAKERPYLRLGEQLMLFCTQCSRHRPGAAGLGVQPPNQHHGALPSGQICWWHAPRDMPSGT